MSSNIAKIVFELNRLETLPENRFPIDYLDAVQLDAVHQAADQLLLDALRGFGREGQAVATAYDQLSERVAGFWYS